MKSKVSKIDKILEFFRSKQGHVSMILLFCIVTVTLTSVLFGETMQGIKGWGMWGFGLGLFFAISFEAATTFAALNNYKWFSYACALASVLIARATFSQSINEDIFGEIATWIMSAFPPAFILLASHKLTGKLDETKLQKELSDLSVPTAKK